MVFAYDYLYSTEVALKLPLNSIVPNPNTTILGMSHIDSYLTQPQLHILLGADSQLDQSMTNYEALLTVVITD